MVLNAIVATRVRTRLGLIKIVRCEHATIVTCKAKLLHEVGVLWQCITVGSLSAVKQKLSTVYIHSFCWRCICVYMYVLYICESIVMLCIYTGNTSHIEPTAMRSMEPTLKPCISDEGHPSYQIFLANPRCTIDATKLSKWGFISITCLQPNINIGGCLLLFLLILYCLHTIACTKIFNQLITAIEVIISFMCSTSALVWH